MRMRPRLGDSRPAIRRRTVLLPQAEGPTRTSSSPSPIDSARSRKAVTPLASSLSTPSRLIAAMPVGLSSLDRAGREAGYDAALSQQNQHRHRGRGDHSRRQNLAPGNLILSTEERDRDRHGGVGRSERERQGKQEFIPAV